MAMAGMAANAAMIPVLSAEPVNSNTSHGIAMKVMAFAVAPAKLATCNSAKGRRETRVVTYPW
jgi:hypothetical protein